VRMADHRANIDIVGPRPWFFNVVGRSEPDLRLLKQVEQVTNIDFGRTGPALCQDSEHGDHRRGRVLVFLIRQLLDWLLFGCRNSQEGARGRLFAKRQGRCKGAHAYRPSN
jgi:hypothetical protein